MNPNKFIEDCARSRAKSKSSEKKFLRSQWKMYFGNKAPTSLTNIDMRAKIYSYLSGKNEDDLKNITFSIIKSNEQRENGNDKKVEVKIEKRKDICVYSDGSIKILHHNFVDGMCFPDKIHPILRKSFNSTDRVFAFTDDGKCVEVEKSERTNNKIVSLLSEQEIYIDVCRDGYIRKNDKLSIDDNYSKNLLNVFENCGKIICCENNKLKVVNLSEMKITSNRKKIFDNITHCTKYNEDSFLLIMYKDGVFAIVDNIPKIKKDLLMISEVTCQEKLIVITSDYVLKTVDLSKFQLNKMLKIKLDNRFILHSFLD